MATTGDAAASGGTHESGGTRRDFLYLMGGAVTAVGLAAVAWPFIDSMNPAKDTLALSSIEVDLAPIKEGMAIIVVWRGKPVFVRHRTKKEIKEAEDVKLSVLKDPQADSARVQKGHDKWLVVIGVCTHLGCIPKGNQPGSNRGKYGGWFCPCHGSVFDTSGRIRQGPAPTNLEVPPYAFLSNNKIKIG